MMVHGVLWLTHTPACWTLLSASLLLFILHTLHFIFFLLIAKGKGGEQALKLVEGVAGLDLVLVMVPFFYSNFLAFFTPVSEI